MGAACSSRSASTAVVVNAPTASTERRARNRAEMPGSSRGSSPSPFFQFVADLDHNAQSMDFSGRHSRRRRSASGLRRRSYTPEAERIRQHEIENLQRSLAAMEDFFQSLLGQAQLYMEAMDPSGGGGRGPPPASEAALRQLPKVCLTCQDMENETNRTCGICCENHALGDEVTRMPCGHVYHGGCIEAWLSRHCTCPVCRYELPTDDAHYEPGRLERMAVRKNSSGGDRPEEYQEATQSETVKTQEEERLNTVTS